MPTADGERSSKPFSTDLRLSLLIGLLCWCTAAAVPAQTQTIALAFETEGLDLETGEVIDLSAPEFDEAAADFHLAYNADRTTHSVLFQGVEAEIALMSDTPFDYVTASDIPSLVFTTELIDESCDGGDTVVLRTSGGSVYKIGNLLEDPATGVVVFDYELLESPQAALSPEAPSGPHPGGRTTGGIGLSLAMADSGVGRELPHPGLSTEAHRAIRSYIERDRYGVRRAADGAIDEAALEGANPAQDYSTRFTREGIHVQPEGGDSELGLTLTGWGYGEALAPIAPVSPRADGQRVEYARGALTEWYVNRSSGLEQGFTLAEPPQGARGGVRLRLEMTLSGPLLAEASGGSVLFRDASGRTRLRYGGLKVWDAIGRELAAEMKLAENRLTLEVDDSWAVYPVTVDPTIVNEDAKLLASDGAVSHQFGRAVAVLGDTVVVGASVNNSAYVFEEPAGGWAGPLPLTEAAKLIASDGAGFEQLGASVAISGDTVVVGARLDNDSGGFGAGSAYIFKEPLGGWSGTVNETAKLLASDGNGGDRFGGSVAVSGDTVVVGASFDDDNGTSSGSAYVFEKPVGGWSGTLNQTAKLLPSDNAASDNFGFSVAISGDAVVVGALGDGSGRGSAYLFEEPAGGWSGTLCQTAKLLASDRVPSDSFGRSVAVSGDTVVVGAHLNDDNGTSSGSAYVFEKPVGGWAGLLPLTEAAKLLASDGAVQDNLGYAVAVSGDTVVVGAPGAIGGGGGSGSAYVFEKPVSGWAGPLPLTEAAKLLASDGAASDQFGEAVDVSGDTKVVGVPRDDDKGTSSGSAYVFEFAGDGVCHLEPTTTVCRPAAGECDVAEFCDGAGSCPVDSFEAAGTFCGNPGDGICDLQDICDGSGSCEDEVEPAATSCRADAGECDVEEFCDGAGSCPVDAFEAAGTFCGNPGDGVCDLQDICDGSGSCEDEVEPAVTSCRADTGECDVEEFCDGAGSCPVDAFEAAGTLCGNPGDGVCDLQDICDGSGSCEDEVEPAATSCRADAGECDVEEFCDGAGSCPVDGFEPDSTTCEDGDICTSETGTPQTSDQCVAGVCTGQPVACAVVGDPLCNDAQCNETTGACEDIAVVDTTDPEISCPAGIPLVLDSGCEAQIPDLVSLVTASDECTDPGDLTITQDLAPGSLVGPGSYTVTVTATDTVGNFAQCQTLLTAGFEFDGFLPPIGGADATGGSFADPVRSFKLESTIPVKFKISCSGVPRVEDVHTLQAIHYTSATNSDLPIDATPQDAATTGNEFRLTGDQWHYNLDTQGSGMSKGQWELVATLSDGTTHFVWIQVK